MDKSNRNQTEVAQSILEQGTGGDEKSVAGLDESKNDIVEQPVTSRAIWEILAKQKYRCALTGWPLTPDVASMDHIIPRSKGGKHCAANIQILHSLANRAKNTMSNEEFVEMCKAVISDKSELELPEGIDLKDQPVSRTEMRQSRELIEKSLAGMERRYAADPNDKVLERSLFGMRKKLASLSI